MGAGSYLSGMSQQPKKKTLAGRIIASVLKGAVDGIPIVSQVVNVVQQHKAEQAEPTDTPSDIPLVRILAGVGAVVAFVAAVLKGAVDCDAITAALRSFGLVP